MRFPCVFSAWRVCLGTARGVSDELGRPCDPRPAVCAFKSVSHKMGWQQIVRVSP